MLALVKAALTDVGRFLSENERLKESLTDAKRELKMYKHYNPYKNGKIYRVTNSVDDMVYVGCTYQSLAERWHEHKKDYRRGSSKFYHHMQDLGRNKFKIELLKLAPTISRWHLENAEYGEQIKVPENNRLFVPIPRIPYGLSATEKRQHYRRRNRRHSRRRLLVSVPLAKSSSEEGLVKNIAKIPKRRLEQRSIRSYFSA